MLVEKVKREVIDQAGPLSRAGALAYNAVVDGDFDALFAASSDLEVEVAAFLSKREIRVGGRCKDLSEGMRRLVEAARTFDEMRSVEVMCMAAALAGSAKFVERVRPYLVPESRVWLGLEQAWRARALIEGFSLARITSVELFGFQHAMRVEDPKCSWHQFTAMFGLEEGRWIQSSMAASERERRAWLRPGVLGRLVEDAIFARPRLNLVLDLAASKAWRLLRVSSSGRMGCDEWAWGDNAAGSRTPGAKLAATRCAYVGPQVKVEWLPGEEWAKTLLRLSGLVEWLAFEVE